MSEEVMRFEITDQDLEDEMTSSYGAKRKYGKDVIFWNNNVFHARTDCLSRVYFVSVLRYRVLPNSS